MSACDQSVFDFLLLPFFKTFFDFVNGKLMDVTNFSVKLCHLHKPSSYRSASFLFCLRASKRELSFPSLTSYLCFWCYSPLIYQWSLKTVSLRILFTSTTHLLQTYLYSRICHETLPPVCNNYWEVPFMTIFSPPRPRPTLHLPSSSSQGLDII